ncbi:MAG: DNA repair protein RadA, partial [Oligoflexus sp.]|nr:DNA repair protein RadA [Pseudopedobacter sp.]
MAKIKTSYFCQSCGFESAKWLGKCPSCQQWNTFVEEIVEKGNSKTPDWKSGTSNTVSRVNKPSKVQEIEYTEDHRLITPDKELNRVLGGGI